MATWLEDIIKVMTNLGGQAHYSRLYKEIEKYGKRPLSGNWKSTVRKQIEIHSSDSKAYNSGKNIFYSVDGLGKGVWGLRDYIPGGDNIDLTGDDLAFPEGRRMLRLHITRERNAKLISLAKQLFKQKNGVLCCQICKFIYEEWYGEVGKDFIEVHHIRPISEMDENEETNIEDLLMVCANCHRMLHRRRPWLSDEELANLFKKDLRYI